jgi:hypothetical protein
VARRVPLQTMPSFLFLLPLRLTKTSNPSPPRRGAHPIPSHSLRPIRPSSIHSTHLPPPTGRCPSPQVLKSLILFTISISIPLNPSPLFLTDRTRFKSFPQTPSSRLWRGVSYAFVPRIRVFRLAMGAGMVLDGKRRRVDREEGAVQV